MLNLSKSYIKSIKVDGLNLRYLNARSYSFSSRYEETERVYNIKNKKSAHTMRFRSFYPELSKDRYFKITEREQNRLDIVAQDYYNDASKWWIIAYANNLINCFYVPIGTVLRIPYVIGISG